MSDQEAMRLALRALKDSANWCRLYYGSKWVGDAIRALEKALAASAVPTAAVSNEDNEFMSKIVYHSRILENMGCTVVVFTPEELRGANPYHVQDRLIELGWEVIGDIAEDIETERLVKPSDEDWNWAIK